MKNRIVFCSYLVGVYGISVFGWIIFSLVVLLNRQAEAAVVAGATREVLKVRAQMGNLYAFSEIPTSTLLIGAMVLGALSVIYYTPYFKEYRIAKRHEANLARYRRSRVIKS